MIKKIYRKSAYKNIESQLNQLLADSENYFIFYHKNESDIERILPENKQRFGFKYHFTIENNIEDLKSFIVSFPEGSKINLLLKSKFKQSEFGYEYSELKKEDIKLLADTIRVIKQINEDNENKFRIRLFYYTHSIYNKTFINSLDGKNFYFDLSKIDISEFNSEWNNIVKDIFFQGEIDEFDENNFNLAGTNKELYEVLKKIPEFFYYNYNHLEGLLNTFELNYNYILNMNQPEFKKYSCDTIINYIGSLIPFYNKYFYSMETSLQIILRQIAFDDYSVDRLSELTNIASKNTINSKKVILKLNNLVESPKKGTLNLNDKILELVIKCLEFDFSIDNYIEEQFWQD